MNLLKKSLFASAVLASTSAYSAGVYLHEIGNNDLGLAAAGKAARAQDASVLATNPAGLSNVEGQSFTGGMMTLYGDTEYQMDNGTSAGNIVGFVQLGSAFYSQQMNDRLTLGIGVYGNYGMGLEFDSLPASFLADGVTVDSAVSQALTIQPSASYKLNSQWSLGAGLGIQYGMFSMDTNVADFEDTDIAFNAKLGLLFSPSQDTRIGFGYSSETEFNFDVDNIAPAVMPQTLTLSAFHQVDDRLAVMGNLGWEDWSEFQTTINTPTQDTYHIAIGSRYQVNKKLMWNAGLAFDSSLYENQSSGDFTIPTGDAWRIGTGMEYKLGEGRTMGLAFEVVLLDDSKVSSNQVGNDLSGSFSDPTLYFLTATYSWSGQ